MSPEQFVKSYDREEFIVKKLSPDLESIVAPADDWAKSFGNKLHDYLSGADDAFVTDTLLKSYGAWQTGNLAKSTRTITNGPWTAIEKAEAHQRLNFHWLNSSMLVCWVMEAKKDDPAVIRDWSEFINMSQDLLAIHGVNNYLTRESLAGSKANYAYFGTDQKYTRSFVEGLLNEVDASIVLLEASRKHKWVVLPAPPQFERGVRPSANVDFVVLAPGSQVIGVQVKSKLSRGEAAHYDSEVVLLDGQVDMDNQMGRRTAIEHSDIKVVTWAGIIAAQRAERIATSGNKGTVLAYNPHLRNIVMNSKARARRLVKGMPNALPNATERISERILTKLAQDYVG